MRTGLASGAIALGLLVTAQPGWAECTSAQLQTAANSFFDSTDAAIPAGTVAASLRSIAESCPDDPYTQKIAVLGFANLAARPGVAPDDLLTHASDSFAALERMYGNMPKDNRTRQILNRVDQTVSIGFTDSYDVSKRIINTLLVAEARAGRIAVSNTPPRAGDTPIQCDVYQTGLSQEVSFWIRNNQDSPGGMNIIDKRIANCQGNAYNLSSIHAHRARATLAMLKRAPDRPDADKLLIRTVGDIDVLTSTRESTRFDWGESDQNELERMSWTIITRAGSTLAVTQARWFDTQNLDKMLTNMSIAAALDAAYAKDRAQAGDAVSTLKSYRTLIAEAYKQVQALPADQQIAGRRALYTAAKRHADGVWRAEASKALPKPYDFFYNWIDPNYKPPATPNQTP